MNVIQAAQKHAASTAIEGEDNSYKLTLTLYDGSTVIGKSGVPESGVVMFLAEEDGGQVHCLFINVDHIMSAEVIR